VIDVFVHTGQLKDASWLSFVHNLIDLDLSNNGLTRMPCLDTHLNLQRLCLARNKLTVIGGLEALSRLTDLDVSFNEVKSLLALRTLSLNRNIERLSVHPNPITYSDRYVLPLCGLG
jgi:Leucine-rich repeat (LRR) protein